MKLFLTGYPIIQSKLQEIVSLLQRGENVTSLWMPHSARTEFAIQLRTKNGLSRKDQDELNFGILDLSLSQEYLERRFDEVKKEAMEHIQRGKKAVIIMDNFSLKNVDWVKYVISTRHSLPPRSLSFLILAFESEFYSHWTTETDMSLLYHNLTYVPYFSKEETFEWLDNRHTTNDKERIYEYCGGIVGLIANLEKAIDKNKTVQAALESQQMRDVVRHLWGRFAEKERQLLTSVVTTGKLLPYPFEIEYMKRHRLLDENGTVIGSWVKDVVGVPGELQIKREKDALIWNGINIQEALTEKETAIFTKLLDGNNLSREEISNLLWDSQAQEKYSDWAIDQAMSRLRKKLDQIGIGGGRIKTRKGVGFQLEKIILS